MSHTLDGLQFPIQSNNKASTSKTGQAILAEALSTVNHQASLQVLSEKNWRKQYPIHFKALVEHGLTTPENAIDIAQNGLAKAQHSFDFYRDGQRHTLTDMMALPLQKLHTIKLKGESHAAPEWYVPYKGKNLQGQALLDQINLWQDTGIIEASHAKALKTVLDHPEWFDLSDRTMVLFGAASEAGPLTWLTKWKANIIAVDLQNSRVWDKILKSVQQGNATLYAPSTEAIDSNNVSITVLKEKLGANLLTQTPEIVQWLLEQDHALDLAAIAYLDGEKHVRVSMAMDSIMQHVSEQKPDTSLMYMCTPTDVYAVPADVIDGSATKFKTRSQSEKILCKGIETLSLKHFFQQNLHDKVTSTEGQQYGIADCLVVEQGPNYALAKRIQQWRATLARHQGQLVSINIAPSTTTHSVTKNPLLKAAFNGASLFGVEAFSPETTNAIMAALWIHDLRNPESIANPERVMNHPLELMMEGANHGGLWRVAYLARTALPFAALYGFADEKLPIKKVLKLFNK